MFQCSECGKKYSYNRNLRKHVSLSHPEKSVDSIAPVLCRQSSQYQCYICDKYYASSYDLKRHQQNAHGQHADSNKNAGKCCMCSSEVKTRNDLLKHLEAVHETVVSSEELSFSSISEFKTWKEETEHVTQCGYIKRSIYRTANSVTHYYICDRSGEFHSTSTGIRSLKIQGTKKMGGMCPASITVTEDSNGQCCVTYISTHVGHGIDIGHLKLSEKDRAGLAASVARKIPFQEIIKEIRGTLTDSVLERKHLVTRQDLYNIERSFNLYSGAVRHQNDAISVDAWVREVNSSDNPCVLFYKPQAQTSETYPELKSTDFVLMIMTIGQADMLKKYGNDCICVDSTHGLTSYDFELTTVLVIDDMRQGFPCAFLISNRTDSQVLSLFFKHIEREVGKISPKVFMTDQAESAFIAWSEVMGAPIMRLYCTWHIIKAWENQIRKKIQGQKKQDEVSLILRTILYEQDANRFEQMLPGMLQWLSDDPATLPFALYFKEHYTNNVRNWAYCYRQNAGVNTNMHLERMHRTIKHTYLHRKRGKRLDKAIFTLMNFVNDKMCDRINCLVKGKVTPKLRALRRRHKWSKQIEKALIVHEDGVWKVPSSTNRGIFVVKLNNPNCRCKTVCNKCRTCIHKYTCSCIDASIKANMCVHIHSVCQLEAQHPDNVKNTGEREVLVGYREDAAASEEREGILAQLSKNCRPSSSRKNVAFTEWKSSTATEFSQLLDTVSTTNRRKVVDKFMSSLKATLSATKSEKEGLVMMRPKEKAHKRTISPQRKFFSTKKRKVSRRASLAVPSTQESELIKKSLLDILQNSGPDALKTGSSPLPTATVISTAVSEGVQPPVLNRCIISNGSPSAAPATAFSTTMGEGVHVLKFQRIINNGFQNYYITYPAVSTKVEELTSENIPVAR